MSREDVEIVRRIFDLVGRGAMEESWSLMARDFVLDMSAAKGPYRGVYERADAQEFLKEFTAIWESFEQDVEFIDAGDRVVTPFVFRSRGRSGIEVTARGSYVWTVKDGLVSHCRLYQDHADALEAAGLAD